MFTHAPIITFLILLIWSWKKYNQRVYAVTIIELFEKPNRTCSVTSIVFPTNLSQVKIHINTSKNKSLHIILKEVHLIGRDEIAMNNSSLHDHFGSYLWDFRTLSVCFVRLNVAGFRWADGWSDTSLRVWEVTTKNDRVMRNYSLLFHLYRSDEPLSE